MNSSINCSNCIKGRIISINSDVLCIEKGPVSNDYRCNRYRIKPSTSILLNAKPKCSQCQNFIISDSDSAISETMGLCKIFSVRYFDGNQKKACSKFESRESREAS